MVLGAQGTFLTGLRGRVGMWEVQGHFDDIAYTNLSSNVYS